MLLGPDSLVMSNKNNALFFTDSGPFGESSIEKAEGSVFQIDLEAFVIHPLALKCLAMPTGLAINKDENVLYHLTPHVSSGC